MGRARTVGERLTIPAVLDAQAQKRPDRPFLHILDEPVTYAEMRARAVSSANMLAASGIEPGDRVAIYMGTSAEWIDAWFGAAYLGAVTVPVNAAYRGDFLANQLRDSETKAIAVDASLSEQLLAVVADVPSLRTMFVRADGATDTAADTPIARDRIDVHPIERLREGDTGEVTGGAAPAWNRPGAIFYTSGTTGRSKGALVTQHYLLSAAQTMVDCWQLQPGETVYGPLPLFHLSAVGTVLGPMLAGGTGVLEKVFSVTSTWDQVRRYDAAGIALAGALVVMLWNLPPDEGDRDLPIRFLSAAPVPKEIYHDIEERYGCRIVTVYGTTEAFPLTYAGVAVDNPPGASGRSNPGFEVKIFDDEDNEVPAGTVGEIVCRPRRPHSMFEGYDGRPEATLEQLRNLWFHTGDLGRFDDDGNFTYVDRKKDAMRRRGENISSFEVEQALLRHPAVAEIAAIGVPSELGEDDVMVCVVAKPGEALEIVPFMDFCRDRLPYFAVPRYVEVCAELPKNAVGRVLKHELRARGVSDATWDRERAGYVVRP
ncbi:MAG: AMP-binding protein [Acidimicrobiales bacterium]